MHSAWFSEETPVPPITPAKIRAIAAMLKAGNYGAAANYMSRANAEHIARFSEHGIHWSVELTQEMRLAVKILQSREGSS